MPKSWNDLPPRVLLTCLQKTLERFCAFPVLREAVAGLDCPHGVHLLAIGKDAGRMCDAAVEVLKDKLIDAWCLTKYAHYRCSDSRVVHLEAGHPVPDQNSLQHSQRIVEWLADLPKEADLIVLLSGGGSSLFELPRNDFDLAGLISLNRGLLRSGLGIAAVNASRAKLSRLKGGGALDFFQGRSLRVFALSDVEGDDPAVIASGPFCPPEPDARVTYQVIGNNLSFRTLLGAELAGLGHETSVDRAFLSGDPSGLIELVKACLRDGSSRSRVMIWGGELPVLVQGPGKGGRCTHLALSVAPLLVSHPDFIFVALATDGSDNLSGSAGAWVNSHTLGKLRQVGIDPAEVLGEADSFTALNALGQIIPTGNWHANVNDVYLLAIGAGLDPMAD